MALFSFCQRVVSSASFSFWSASSARSFSSRSLRRGVLLLGQRHLLDLEATNQPLDLVDLDGPGVDLHPQPRRRLVDQVDGLVGQEARRDVAVGQRGRRDQRGVGDADTVVHLVAVLEAAQDADGVLDRRLADQHLLEATFQRGVLLDVLAVLVERGGADQSQLAAGQHRLDHVARVHRRLAGRAGADDGVQLVDEGDDLAGRVLDVVEHGLEPLLELAAVLRTRPPSNRGRGRRRFCRAGSPARRPRRCAGPGPRRSRSCRRRARRSAPGCSWCDGSTPARRDESRCRAR